MIPQSRLDKTLYKMADVDKWLKGDTKYMDPVTAGRAAYFGYDHDTVIDITDGHRPYADQEKAYKRFLAGELISAATPGRSWHGPGLAFDSSTPVFRQATSKELQFYGLCKPLKNEPWHAQPIETLGKSYTQIPVFAPIDLAPLMKAKFGLSDPTLSYIETYKYAVSFCEQLLAGDHTFDQSTIDFFKKYKFWPFLEKKLDLKVAA